MKNNSSHTSYTKQLEEQIAALEQQIAAHNAEFDLLETQSASCHEIVSELVSAIISKAYAIIVLMRNVKKDNDITTFPPEMYEKIRNLRYLLDLVNDSQYKLQSPKESIERKMSFIKNHVKDMVKQSRFKYIKEYTLHVFATTILEDTLTYSVSLNSLNR